MLKKLTLENFKNFRHTELELGPFTVLIGANATGKSNIREAFRFLHGIGRGYTLPDIIGEKWLEGGVRVWNGIRGGTQELIYQHPVFPFDPFNTETFPKYDFTLEVDFSLQGVPASPPATYIIRVASSKPDNILFIHTERLSSNGNNLFAYRYTSSESPNIEFAGWSWHRQERIHQPLLSSDWYDIQMPLINETGEQEWIDAKGETQQQVLSALHQFKSLRFFDFVPDAMRKPSFPGQIVLGDNGENFSSVLYAIYQDEQKRAAFIEWLRELTPMDVVGLEFPPDQVGRVLATLVEKDGRKISAYSASDGTLRLLGLLAALLGPEPADFYFFEELENGIHPSRLHLLLELIEQVTAEGNIQVVATTHSPQLLGLVSEQTLNYASMTYRLEGQPDAHIQRIIDIPDAKEIFREEDLSRLYEKGWLENSVHFMQNLEKSA